jgi:glycosyltransferase involved in cell wall biosynthesis
VHFTEAGGTPLTGKDLPFCRDVVAVPKPAAYGPWQLLQGVFGHWPLQILNCASPDMTSAVRRLMDSSAYDLIHLDSIHMIRYAALPEVRRTRSRIVLNWHNIESEVTRRYSENAPSFVRRWYAKHTAHKLEVVERETLRTAFGHVVCSQRECDQLHSIHRSARIAVVENGVDVRYFAGAGAGGGGASGSAGRNLLFVGSMAYYPNVQAAITFARGIWPSVREKLPGARLFIVGFNPGPEVLELASIEGVTVTGTVPDVRPYYRDALAAIVPLRSGGGTRLKILEAMAAGVPVISTELGAEGLAVAPGQDILVADADDAEAWIRHLTCVSESAGLRKQLVAAGRHLVQARYDWENLGETLATTYQD